MSSTITCLPTNKLLNRERPNSANAPVEPGLFIKLLLLLFYFIYLFLEEKRDFVEQLNELSLKQHHRQYSGKNEKIKNYFKILSN